MQIILFREKRGRTRSQGISGGVLATIAAVVLAGLLGDAYLLALYFDQDRGTNDLPYLQAKVNCSEAAVRVTSDLMTCFTGTAFARRSPIERYFRDARAGLVMGMANDVAYQNMIPHLFPEA